MELHRPRARLDRAIVHRNQFGQVWSDFLGEDDPYITLVSIDDNGEGVIRAEASPDLPAKQLALHFGEMLYQLRAALDSLVYELAIRVSGQDPPPQAEHLEFLIRPSEPAFDSAAWKIKPLSDRQRGLIESVQPYLTEEGTEGELLTRATLKELNDLARKDRHRGLRVIASWVSNKNPKIETMPAGCSLEWLKVTEDGLLDDQGVLAGFKIRGWQPGGELEANPNCAIDVTVEDAPPPATDDDTLNQRARTMIAVVSLIIQGFEHTLD